MVAETDLDGRGIEDIFRVLRPKVSPILARYQIPAADGDDLLQEAILAALKRQPPPKNIKAWLLIVVRNRCSVYRRRQTCWDRLVQSVDHSELQALASAVRPPQEHEDVRRDLRRLSRHLNAEEKELLRMCFGDDLRRKEVAARFRCHPANIVKVLRRVLDKLRAAARLQHTAYL